MLKNTIEIDDGDAVIVIKKNGGELTLGFNNKGVIGHAELLALGISWCYENEEWTKKIILRAHEKLNKIYEERRES